MTATRDQIVRLIRTGATNTAIARDLHCDRHRVRDIRRSLGIPSTPAPLPTLDEKWAARTRPVDGGHLEWTGERQRASGTPVLRYREESYSPTAIAFRLRHGHDAQGYVIAGCGMQHCVAPAHVDDQAARVHTREQLRYLKGGGRRAAVCRHGHNQVIHGLYETDGRAYCGECKRLSRKASA